MKHLLQMDFLRGRMCPLYKRRVAGNATRMNLREGIFSFIFSRLPPSFTPFQE
ncbi:MAG: hypothetical protein M5U11_14570 [Anaerolineales bacterium]|nr:hypothetical protein [Anaerolineales bacterium]